MTHTLVNTPSFGWRPEQLGDMRTARDFLRGDHLNDITNLRGRKLAKVNAI